MNKTCLLNNLILTIKQFIYNVKCLGKELNLPGLINHIPYELKVKKIELKAMDANTNNTPK